jgi:hypothetical protein
MEDDLFSSVPFKLVLIIIKDDFKDHTKNKFDTHKPLQTRFIVN